MTSTIDEWALPFTNAIESMEKILSCAICFETSLEPVETRCGHLFCKTCIQQIISRPGDSCPLCKLVLTRRNVLFDTHIGKCVKQLSKLVESIRTDTSFDVRQFSKFHHKKQSSILTSICGNKVKNRSNHIEPISEIQQKSSSEAVEQTRTVEPSNTETAIESTTDKTKQQKSKQQKPQELILIEKTKTTEQVSSDASKSQSLQFKERKSMDSVEKVVGFKKLGKLFKANRRGIPFLYFGATRKQDSKNYSHWNLQDISNMSYSRLSKECESEFSKIHKQTSICGTKISACSRPDNVCNTQERVEPTEPIKQPEEITVRPESHTTSEKSSNVLFSSKPSDTLSQNGTRYSHSSTKSQTEKSSTSVSPSPSFHKSEQPCTKQQKTSKTRVRSVEKLSLEDWSSGLSPSIIRKRKRSESSDDHHLHGEKKTSQDPTPSKVIASESVEGTPENLRQVLNNKIWSNETLASEFEQDAFKCRFTPEGEISTKNKLDKVMETIPSDSFMDITGEEMLFKQFEKELFGSKEPGIPCSSGSEQRMVNTENIVESSPLAERTLTETQRELDKSMTDINSVDGEQLSRNSGSINPTPVLRSESSSNFKRNEVSSTALSICHDQDDQRPKNYFETPTTPTGSELQYFSRRIHSAQEPLHQSTPKSSHPKKVVECSTPTTYGTTNIEKSSLCIVCSGLNSKQAGQVKYFANLFHAKYTEKFSADVTHVIVKTNDSDNAAYKTLKYLQGIAHRKWIVNIHWIENCMAQKKIIDEEMYEVVDSTTLIEGPKKARLGEKRPFENFVFLCIEPFTNISLPDYEDLLRRTGAKVVSTLDELAAEKSLLRVLVVEADYHDSNIIEWYQKTRAIPVAHEWIIECISQYRLVSLLPFLQELLPRDVLDLGFPADIVQKNDMDFTV